MNLLSLALDSFKGTKHFSFVPGGASADIFGDNGTGKTTLADAYFWLLFGKDFSGRSDSNFDVKTRGTTGLDYSVSGEFKDNDGHTFTLRRVYKEKFARENGAAEREYRGNTTDFFINDVPKPKKDYTAFVAGICDEQTFMLLTDPDMFPGKLKWDERRNILLQYFAPESDDHEIINAHEDLKPLINYIGYKSVDDYAEITKALRKKANEQLKAIPNRIDEAEKAKPLDLPSENDGPAMARLASKKMKLDAAIQSAETGESVSALRKKNADIQADISEARVTYSKKFANGNTAIESESRELRNTINKLNTEISTLTRNIGYSNEFLHNSSEEIDQLRDKWAEENDREPTEDNTCPVCGQMYPEEKIEKITAEFNEQKAKKLEKILDKANDLKDDHASTEELLKKQTEQLQAAEHNLKTSQARLEKLSQSYVNPPAFEESTEYRALANKLEDSQLQLSSIKNGIEARVSSLKQQRDDADFELDTIKARMASKSIVEQQDKRIEELKAEEKGLAQTLATYDNGLLLAEKFVQTKATDIEQQVNSAFKFVRWKLFDMQVNGGIKACCEATVKGIEYGTNLNSAAKLNAGLDIINTLSAKVGTSVPIWIDNAESVTSFLQVDAQVIRLHVSENDKKLRVEVR